MRSGSLWDHCFLKLEVGNGLLFLRPCWQGLKVVGVLYIYIQANPNQVTVVEPLLAQRLEELVPVLESIQ
jgi:hypothetical protein